MIRLPDLDDQRYSDIVEAAKRRIPVLYPEWTDFNEHDPGITMIELFAWLKEMQQYYLNRISDRSYENMLRLLGVEPLSAAPATAEIRFPADAPDMLICGAEAATEDGTVFVSEETFVKAPFRLGRIYVESPEAVHDVTDITRDDSTDFYPFTAQHHMGERSLYIGLDVTDPAAFAQGARIFFEISDKNPVARNPVSKENCRLPRRLAWEYSTAEGFSPCAAVEDGTLALSFSGSITLTSGEDIAPTDCDGKLPKATYIRVRLLDSGCEDLPAIQTIYINRLLLTQKQRESTFMEFVLTEEKRLTVSDKLLIEGLSYVLIRDEGGWRYAENATLSSDSRETVIDLSECGFTPVMDGAPNVRVIYCREHFGRTKMFFNSDGLPAQCFPFDLSGELLTEDLRIMVSHNDAAGNAFWNDYSYVDSLALAGPYDRCFTYDRERRMLVFGDNENGEVPQRGDDRIMIISCSHTEGRAGNIRRGNLKTLQGLGSALEIKQVLDAEGGRDRESLQGAMDRLKLRMSECVKAVTAEDYRRLASQTPGLRIADVKAIPYFDPDVPAASRDKLANTITLAVLPYSPEKYPIPNESFLAAVKDHIEDHRMITTYVKVVAPIYVNVDISAEVICTSREVEQVRARVAQAIRNMYSVYHSTGTKFGEPVTEVEVMGEISGVDGILSVKHLRIRVEDSRCHRDKYGRIIIPPHAIACCGRIQIEVTEP